MLDCIVLAINEPDVRGQSLEQEIVKRLDFNEAITPHVQSLRLHVPLHHTETHFEANPERPKTSAEHVHPIIEAKLKQVKTTQQLLGLNK
jgi:hypothetical protein